jgi:Transposase IS4
MDMRRPLKPEELEAIINEMSDIEYNSDSEYVPSDDDGEIDIEVVTQGEENSEIDNSNDSDSDEIDNVEMNTITEPNLTFISKNQQVWLENPVNPPQGRQGQHNILREKSGPTRYARREVDSIPSAFFIYFRRPCLKIIIKWTNVEGYNVFGNKWKPLDQNEFRKFIGLLILIGVYKSKNEEISQLWSNKDGRKNFNDIKSRTRFQRILRVIRFDNAGARREKRSTDKLQPIRECFEMWNDHLQDGFIPGWSMTVDEQLVTYRGRCPFRQYIPSKPGRYGIKFWAICDSVTSYAWKLEI